MTLKFILCSLLVLNFSLALAGPHPHRKPAPINVISKVIYGIDNRLDVYQSSDSLMRELSRSSAAQILNSNLIFDGNSYSIADHTLEDAGICRSERFSNQPAVANCSGFLISPDTLVTAGHCITSVDDCNNHMWVFDYSNSNDNGEENSKFTFSKDQVFRCTKVLAREKNESTQNDYAVVKLDRRVPNRTPFKIRSAGRIADDAVLTVIGNPSGLPTKITAAADMRDNQNSFFFTTNADTYGGNSGSAVVDSRTGVVEGILVRGDQDYTTSDRNDSGACLLSVIRDLNGGRGEDVTRITNINFLQKR